MLTREGLSFILLKKEKEVYSFGKDGAGHSLNLTYSHFLVCLVDALDFGTLTARDLCKVDALDIGTLTARYLCN